MKLLQHSWSDMLVLDHLHQRMHNGLSDETTLHNGQKFDLLCLGLLGLPALADYFNELQTKLADLKFDVSEYICVKFLLLLNPGIYYSKEMNVTISKLFCHRLFNLFSEVKGITNKKCVQEGYETVQTALLDYTLTCYPNIQVIFTFDKNERYNSKIRSLANKNDEISG